MPEIAVILIIVRKLINKRS